MNGFENDGSEVTGSEAPQLSENTDNAVNTYNTDDVIAEADDKGFSEAYTPQVHSKCWFLGRPEKRYLWLCFLIPAAIMLCIYIAKCVWPFGEESVLVLDLNAQYVYYIEKFRSVIADGGSFLYTFNRALGGEFMGIVAYYTASPFNLLTLLFPKTGITEALLLILVLKCGFSGLTFGIYIHNSRDVRRPVMTVMFSCMYALSAYAVIMQNNLMWTDNIICLPLIMLGIDRVIKYGKFKTFIIFLAYAIFSNFYIGYMTCIFVAFYFFIRYFSMSPTERNPLKVRRHFPKALGRTVLFSLVAVMISAVMIFSAYYSLTFGKLEFSDPDYTPSQLFNFTDLLSKVFFGSYDTVRPEGYPHLYCGMLMPMLLPLFFVSPEVSRRKKICGGILILFFTVGFTLSTADLIWHGFQRPNWLNARFAFMFVAVVLLMSYDALCGLKKIGSKAFIAVGGVLLFLLFYFQQIGQKNLPTFVGIWASIGLIGVYLCIVPFASKHIAEPGLKAISVVLAAVTCVELFLAGVVNIYSLDEDVVFSSRSSYRTSTDKYREAMELVEDNSFYRSEKQLLRKVNDNMALGINGISNSTSTLNKSVIELLSSFGYNARSHWSKYSGGTMLTDTIFGIKYLYVDKSGCDIPWFAANYYDLIGETDDDVLVYKNPFALSLAYGIDSDIENYSTEGKNAFTVMNDMFTMIYGEEYDGTEVWRRIDGVDSSYNNCRQFGVEQNHTGYEKTGDNAYVTYEFTASSTDPVYMYIPSKWPRDAVLFVNGVEKGNYFTASVHGVQEIGEFNVGDKVTVKLKLSKEKLYVANGDDYFYYFNKEAFDGVKDSLDPVNLNITEYSESSIYGTVTIPSESDGRTTLLTTIPYDEGWVLTVDGAEHSYDKALGALISVDLEPGEHTIELNYRPKYVEYGGIISAVGILIFAVMCFLEQYSDRKKRKKNVLPEKEMIERIYE